MKEQFEEIKVEIIEFAANDVITTSEGGCEIHCGTESMTPIA